MRHYFILFMALLLGAGCQPCLLDEKEVAFIHSLNFKEMSSEDYLENRNLIHDKIGANLDTYTTAEVTLKNSIFFDREHNSYSYETEQEMFLFFIREIPSYMSEHFTHFETYYDALLSSFKELNKNNKDVCSYDAMRQYYLVDRFLIHSSSFNNIYLPNNSGPIIIETGDSNRENYEVNIISDSENAINIAFGTIRKDEID